MLVSPQREEEVWNAVSQHEMTKKRGGRRPLGCVSAGRAPIDGSRPFQACGHPAPLAEPRGEPQSCWNPGSTRVDHTRIQSPTVIRASVEGATGPPSHHATEVFQVTVPRIPLVCVPVVEVCAV